MLDVHDLKLLQESLARYDFLINCPLLQELSHSCLIPPLLEPASIRLLLIKNLPESETVSTFQFILNALNSLDETIGYLLDFKSSSPLIYLGIKGNSPFAISVLQDGLIASFPGIILEEVTDTPATLQALFYPSLYSQLAAVTVIPNTSAGTNLLSDFTSLMKTGGFTAFFLAHPISRCEAAAYYNELCELYNTLSRFSQVNIGQSNGLSKNSSTTVLQGNTITRGGSSTKTCGFSHQEGSAKYNNITISTACPISILHHTKNINGSLSYLINSASNCSHSDTGSTAEGSTYSHASLNNTSRLSAENRTDNNTLGFSIQNKCVQNALTILSNIINRLNILSQVYSYQYGAYFFSSSPAAAIRAAYSFLGLAADKDIYLGPSAVNLFDASYPDYSEIYTSLLQFEHPRFCISDSSEALTSTTLIQSTELLNSIYLPVT